MKLNSSFALRSLALASTLAFSQWAGATTMTITGGTATVSIQGSLAAPNAGASSFNVPLAGYAVAPNSSYNWGAAETNSTSTSTAVVSNGTDAKVTFIGEASIVNGSLPAGGPTTISAAPQTGPNGTPITYNYLSTNTKDGNGTVFTNTANPATVTSGGAYILSFNSPQPAGAAQTEKYLGLLWGSIGSNDLLTFYNGGSLVGTINGTQAQQAATAFNPANGAQNAGGSQYMVINFLTGGFDTVVFSSSPYGAFESAGIQFSTTNVSAIPEPGSVMLLGIGLAGVAAARRRKAVRA